MNNADAWIIKGCSFTLILFFCICIFIVSSVICDASYDFPQVSISAIPLISASLKSYEWQVYFKKSFSDRKIVALNHLLVLSPYIHLQDSSCLEKNKKKRKPKMKAKRYFCLFTVQFKLKIRVLFDRITVKSR